MPPADTRPLVCRPVSTVDQPLLDYDGELDHAIGGAFLFVNSGDGVTYGTMACFGAPSEAHHGTVVYAQDVLGFGPRFAVTADSSALPWSVPDCGDQYVEPCTGSFRGIFGTDDPGVGGFPAGVCNPRDRAAFAASTAVGPSRLGSPFGPGVNGPYVVFLQPDPNNGRFPTSGHVWTA